MKGNQLHLNDYELALNFVAKYGSKGRRYKKKCNESWFANAIKMQCECVSAT